MGTNRTAGYSGAWWCELALPEGYTLNRHQVHDRVGVVVVIITEATLVTFRSLHQMAHVYHTTAQILQAVHTSSTWCEDVGA